MKQNHDDIDIGYISNALALLCDSFLLRSKDDDQDPLWKEFYEIQMSIYLLSKKNLHVSIPEGDMIHDLIKDSWIQVKDYLEKTPFGPVQNIPQWFRTIRIDFPLDEMYTISESNNNDKLIFG